MLGVWLSLLHWERKPFGTKRFVYVLQLQIVREQLLTTFFGAASLETACWNVDCRDCEDLPEGMFRRGKDLRGWCWYLGRHGM
jgi:hypothetical protein